MAVPLVRSRLLTFSIKPLTSVVSSSPRSSPLYHIRTMTSTTKDASSQSDIGKMKTEADGSFKRAASSFRNFIENDGKFPPEKGRYHLYVSYACPWATRTLITRKVKGLEDFIAVSVVSPHMGAQGWAFKSADPSWADADDDTEHPNFQHVKELYFLADQNYGGRFTVPVLWDKKLDTIVNNESSEIIRMFNTAFNHLLPADKAAIDIYPEAHRQEIDSINEWVYDTVNNGVYKSGFAQSQSAYENACKDYLVGNTLTEADIRLFVTTIRFDPVYVGHFKCNLRDIRHGYPNIYLWMRKLYWNNDAFKSSTKFDHIKEHYYWSQTLVNPSRVVPAGPVLHIEPL
ncbi:glutathione S-transferase [Suillus occidentalis]|nr:glutathione S-transferase [Suillus occidentalis]